MKKYREYMDGVQVSDTLRQRLAGLEQPGKRPVQWFRYGSMAAALLLVCGLGAWGLGRAGGWKALAANFRPAATTAPENAGVPVPDIALVEPGDVADPGKKTLGGYEVTDGVMTSYYVLPYIDYGDTGYMSKVSQIAADWDLPRGATRRDLTREEIIALTGGEDVLSTHLDWDGYTLTGWAAWYEDGSFWGAYIYGGWPGAGPAPVERFEFAVTANYLPPTCFAYPDSVTQEVRGLSVTAYGHDGESASVRRVSFMKGDYGYRFDLTGADAGLAEERVSRLVRQVADQGLALDTLSSDGAVPVHPYEADPSYGVGEPNYEDGVPAQETCPDCGAAYPAGTDHQCEICGYSLAPDARICETCGETIPAGMNHDCAMCDGYPAPHLCEVCGETYPEGTAHSHTCEVCGQSVQAGAAHSHTCGTCGQSIHAGEHHTHTCEVCGQTLAGGVEHSHGVTCPDCGQEYAVGAAHTCRQGEHHQEGHHGGHH